MKKDHTIKPKHHGDVRFSITKKNGAFQVEYPPGTKIIRGDSGEDLLARIQAGDRNAWLRFVEIFENSIQILVGSDDPDFPGQIKRRNDDSINRQSNED